MKNYGQQCLRLRWREWVAKVYYNIGGGVKGKCLAGAKLAPLL
jgi:hypothetical protein